MIGTQPSFGDTKETLLDPPHIGTSMPTTVARRKTSQKAFSAKIANLAKNPETSAISSSDVREGLPYEQLELISEKLELTQETVIRVLDISERTLQRRRSSGRLSPSESDRLWRITRIWSLALRAFDGEDGEAREWLTSPNRTLSGDTPVEHLDTEPGLRIVEQMLAVIEHTMPA